MADTETLAKKDVLSMVKGFLLENFLFMSGDEDEIGDDASFMETGIIDSTGILELIEFVEETYSITVEDDELLPENLDSLNNISNFILAKRIMTSNGQ